MPPPSVQSTIAKLLPQSPWSKGAPTLYQTLSRMPRDGVGSRVAQSRWEAKGIRDSYWEITKVKLKDGGKHGKVWGYKYWKGDLVTPKEELVRGGLKYQWKVLPKESEETLLSEQPATQAAPPTDTQHPPQ